MLISYSFHVKWLLSLEQDSQDLLGKMLVMIFEAPVSMNTKYLLVKDFRIYF